MRSVRRERFESEPGICMGISMKSETGINDGKARRNKNMDPVVIFGAGNGGMIVKWMLEDFGVPIRAFTDNNKSKWGTLQDGLPVIAPEALRDSGSSIVIASTWENEIAEQLHTMGISDRIIGKEHFMYEYFQGCAEEFSYLSEYCIDDDKKITFLFGTDLGLYQGGVESWTYTIADELKSRGYEIKILTSKMSKPAPERFGRDTYYLNMRGKGYCSGLKDTVNVIMENAPCVVIDSWQSMTMLAAAIVKRQNSRAVRNLIEVVHSDLYRLFRIVKTFEKELDFCMGVSRGISQYLLEKYKMDPKKFVIKKAL